jgi:hypothetical protein
VIGHDGGTIGQYAFLRVLPERGSAVCLLTNGGHAGRLYQDLFTEVFARWDVRLPDPIAPPASPPAVDPAPYVGRYERESARIEIEPAPAGLRMTFTDTGPLSVDLPDRVQHMDLAPAGQDWFVTRASDADPWRTAVFYRLPSGEAYLHVGGRATPRTG